MLEIKRDLKINEKEMISEQLHDKFTDIRNVFIAGYLEGKNIKELTQKDTIGIDRFTKEPFSQVIIFNHIPIVKITLNIIK